MGHYNRVEQTIARLDAAEVRPSSNKTPHPSFVAKLSADHLATLKSGKALWHSQ